MKLYFSKGMERRAYPNTGCPKSLLVCLDVDVIKNNCTNTTCVDIFSILILQLRAC